MSDNPLRTELLNLRRDGLSRFFICLMYGLAPVDLSEIIGLPKPRRGRYSEDIKQRAIMIIENNDKNDGPPANYLEVADFLGPCSSTIRRWVRESRFLHMMRTRGGMNDRRRG